MKYISQDSQQPLPSPHNGYWVKDQYVYEVSESSHIAFMLDHTHLFSISLEEIKEAYSKNAEPFGTDGGKVREYLIRRATRLGWIRVRKYEKPSYVSIQCNSTHNQRSDIVAFLKWAIESGVIRADDAAVILGFQDERDRHSYTWEEGGIGRYIESTDLGDS